MAGQQHPVIAGIGEVLWDVFPGGRAVGGAPANFAYHAGCLGADAGVISRVGDDGDGRELVARLAGLGLDTSGVSYDPAHPTGMVNVSVGADGQPEYTIAEGVAWDFIEVHERALERVRRADALVFGTLAQRSAKSRQTIRTLVAEAPALAFKLFDINLRPPFIELEVIESSLVLANAMKLNDEELPVLEELLGSPGSDPEGHPVLQAAAERFELEVIALTRGARGSLLYSRGQWSELPGEPVDGAVDTVGAGDSFSAALVTGWLAGRQLDAINRSAASLARHVCRHEGAMPPVDDALRAEVTGVDPPS